jgi:hypothetical protein
LIRQKRSQARISCGFSVAIGAMEDLQILIRARILSAEGAYFDGGGRSANGYGRILELEPRAGVLDAKAAFPTLAATQDTSRIRRILELIFLAYSRPTGLQDL